MSLKSQTWDEFFPKFEARYKEYTVSKITGRLRKRPSGEDPKYAVRLDSGVIADIQVVGSIRILTDGPSHDVDFTRVRLAAPELEQRYPDRVHWHPGTSTHSSVTISTLAKVEGSANPKRIAEELLALFEGLLEIFMKVPG
jgi:hypothetical protein